MAFTTETLVDGLRFSRRHFLKHLDGLREDQWDWKPYPECKTVRETLAHLVQDDRAALQALETGGEPDYDSWAEPERDREKLRALLDESHARLCAAIHGKYGDAPMETVASAYGAPMPLGAAIPYLSSEDYYHAGQVAFIRQATDPGWDYYAAIYGAG